MLLLLLLNHFSHVRLCATPWTEARQALPSLGFSRQEYWSGLPLPSPTLMLVVVYSLSHIWLFCDPMDRSLPTSSVHGISQTNAGVGCHFLLQAIFLTQRSNPRLQHWQADFIPLRHQGSPTLMLVWNNKGR